MSRGENAIPITNNVYTTIMEDGSENPQPPETRLEIDWGEHNWKDSCPWINEKPLEILDDEQTKRRIFDELKAYMAIKSDTPSKIITEGEFALNTYPKGTVVRYSNVREIPNSQPSENTYWGILTQVKGQSGVTDVVYSFPEWMINQGTYPNQRNIRYGITRDIPIGEPIHDRRSGMFGLSKIQSLGRVDKLEIWKFGQELRETVPQSSTELSTTSALSPTNS